MASEEFSLPVKVYIEDTDAGGIVYHANYLKFMERARTEFISQLGYHKPALLDGGLLLVVHSMALEFKQAATLAENLLATAAVKKVARTYVVFEQGVRKAVDESSICCRADVKIACVEKSSLKPAPMPESLRQALLKNLPLN